jgi:hypothetical protein
MSIKFCAGLFFAGLAISGISLWTVRGCGRYFQTGLFWFLAYFLPQLGRGAFIVNAIFHGLSLVLMVRLVHSGLGRATSPTWSKLASTVVALIVYCLFMFVLFPIQECTI